MVLDEVHHRAEMSTQRSTAAWSSSSYLRNRNGALQGVQEENSREGSCNLGVLWLCVPPLNCVLPLNSVGEGCSITSDALIPTHTGLRDVLTFEVVVSRPRHSLSWTRSEFPQTPCQRLAGKKEDRRCERYCGLRSPFFFLSAKVNDAAEDPS